MFVWELLLGDPIRSNIEELRLHLVNPKKPGNILLGHQVFSQPCRVTCVLSILSSQSLNSSKSFHSRAASHFSDGDPLHKSKTWSRKNCWTQHHLFNNVWVWSVIALHVHMHTLFFIWINFSCFFQYIRQPNTLWFVCLFVLIRL